MEPSNKQKEFVQPQMRLLIYAACAVMSAHFSTRATGQGPTALNPCHGTRVNMTVSSSMPYLQAKVGGIEASFVLDYGALASVIDVQKLPGLVSSPVSPPYDVSVASFDFFGPWGQTRFKNGSMSIQGTPQPDGSVVVQKGIIGIDFLEKNIFTLDYANRSVWRNDNFNNFCKPDVLQSEGFRAVSSGGYFMADGDQLATGTFNTPTVLFRVGGVFVVAQVDTGLNDRAIPHSININQHLLDLLISAGLTLQKGQQTTSTTCVSGVSEHYTAYKLAPGTKVEIVAQDGKPFILPSDVSLLLKESPKEALDCKGIGVWPAPAAQMGASFLNDAKQVVFDPYHSVVWFGTKP